MRGAAQKSAFTHVRVLRKAIARMYRRSRLG